MDLLVRRPIIKSQMQELPMSKRFQIVDFRGSSLRQGFGAASDPGAAFAQRLRRAKEIGSATQMIRPRDPVGSAVFVLH
jgi:hypothetical protein